MDFNDGVQEMVWRNKVDVIELNYLQLKEEMLKEAEREGYEPFDFNYAGNPNIYLRGIFNKDNNDLVGEGYAMFVRKIKKEKTE